MSDEIKQLEYAIREIMEIADGFGLDYYPMRYEICPADIIYTFGAYGMRPVSRTGASAKPSTK
ncbi:SpoVR like protein [Paenibacillus sp. P1XP2]|nr:SpoVR like protein [Paenibacillus sp. P1XP2]